MSRPIIFLVGGRSTEHDASLHSYAAFREALLREQAYSDHHAGVYYITRNGGVRAFPPGAWPSLDELESGQKLSLVEACSKLQEQQCYLFSLLHGNEGEDGAFQGLAEIFGLEGNFGSVLASALTMSKWELGLVMDGLKFEGVKTPKSWIIDTHQPNQLDAIIRELDGRPCVVKPNAMGASLLTTLVENPSAEVLKELIEEIKDFDTRCLVQAFIQGDEYTCGCVRKQSKFMTLPVVQAETDKHFLGHEEKHRAGLVNVIFHEQDTPLTKRIKEFSAYICDVLKLPDMARLDFIYHQATDTLYFLEVNTLPGFGCASIFPKMLAGGGISLKDLLSICVENARDSAVRNKYLPYDIDSAER